jgi:uncharacterized protein (DUF1778 family)
LYAQCLYAIFPGEDDAMPRQTTDKTERFNMRIPPSQKAMIARAAALTNRDMTDFILDRAVAGARAVIEAAESETVSARDFARITELLENPPKPNDRLRAAIAALPDDR